MPCKRSGGRVACSCSRESRSFINSRASEKLRTCEHCATNVFHVRKEKGLSTITRIKRERKKQIILQRSNSPDSSTSAEPTASTSTATSANSTIKVPTPGKTRSRPPHNKLDVDDFTMCAIQNIIESFIRFARTTNLKKKADWKKEVDHIIRLANEY
ncbi:unnamed protein product [Arctia plantaginis]|uniref:Uncharacterized protein n=1 Tax=Arctia plantaginis TaxID=874455 RepID=A0A8S0Z818_ARCPL|nr:unnamed protein product [Arctia plantaginis]